MPAAAAAAALCWGALQSAPAERNRVLPGGAGRWLSVAVGTAVEHADSHPPTVSAMHTAAAWLHDSGASAAQGLAAVPAATSSLGLRLTRLFSMALPAQTRFYSSQSIPLGGWGAHY